MISLAAVGKPYKIQREVHLIMNNKNNSVLIYTHGFFFCASSIIKEKIKKKMKC